MKSTPKKTQLKNSSKRKLSFTTSNFEDTCPFSPLKYEADVCTNDSDSNPTSDTEDVDLKYLQNILPSVLKELASVGKDNIPTKFMVLVCAKKFPLTYIKFSLFCDVVPWYSLSDTRCMRYSEDTMHFFGGWSKTFRREICALYDWNEK